MWKPRCSIRCGNWFEKGEIWGMNGKISPEMHLYYLGLGGNLGDRRGNIQAALESLASQGMEIVACSSLYETAPWGLLDQPNFLNAVAAFSSPLAPEIVIGITAEVEQKMGRVRGVQNGPRNIDIDILACGDMQVDLPGLQLPHPRLASRAFVLVPWAEIAAEFEVPGTGLGVRQLLEQLPVGEVEGVRRVGVIGMD